MTYEQYWYGDVLMVRAFREADKLRRQRMNAEAHLQGMYFYEALLDVSPILHAFAKKGAKPRKYPQEPYKLTSDEKADEKQETAQEAADREEREAAFAKLYMYNMVREGKNWGKK